MRRRKNRRRNKNLRVRQTDLQRRRMQTDGHRLHARPNRLRRRQNQNVSKRRHLGRCRKLRRNRSCLRCQQKCVRSVGRAIGMRQRHEKMRRYGRADGYAKELSHVRRRQMEHIDKHMFGRQQLLRRSRQRRMLGRRRDCRLHARRDSMRQSGHVGELPHLHPIEGRHGLVGRNARLRIIMPNNRRTKQMRRLHRRTNEMQRRYGHSNVHFNRHMGRGNGLRIRHADLHR